MNNQMIFADFLHDYIIEIPRIQRDYVQGRANNSDEKEKRDNFINNLIRALLDPNYTCALDFIYGTISVTDKQKVFIPLDGQQRLTSLYLLHWYLLYDLEVKKTDESEPFDKDGSHLKLLNGHFKYANRNSSTEFCDRLTTKETFNFEHCGDIVYVITQQAWFDDEWVYDPTIETMLTMLSVIEGKLKKQNYDTLLRMSNRLYSTEEKAIYFDTLNLEELHQSESLYIKMNARGKKLTKFENWKSKFTKMLADKYPNKVFTEGDKDRCNTSYKDYFSYSIEHDWNNIFWKFVTKNKKWNTIDDVINSNYPTVDRSFSNFLKFLHIILFYKKIDDPKSKTDLFQWTFEQNEDTYGESEENLIFLFECLDFLSSIKDFDTFFSEIFYTKDNNTNSVPDNKVRFYGKCNTNLFEVCIGSYVNDKGKTIDNREDQTKFDLTSQFLLFAILRYCAPLFCKERLDKYSNGFIVDESLKNYVRECRNFLEEKDQFLTGSVSISPDIRISDSSIIVQGIDNRKSFKQNYISNPSLQTLQNWLGDFSYLGGYARSFKTILDNINNNNTSITIDDIISFMKAFDGSTTIKRIQMLIGAGYKGKRIGGVGYNRERYFFGQTNRWNVLFIEDHQTISKIIEKLIIEYKKNKDVDILINNYTHQAKPNTFAYYMLTYPYTLWAPNEVTAAIEGSQGGTYYYAVLGDIDDMDLISMHSISAQPLSAYHIDPLICSIMNNCIRKHSLSNLQKKFSYIGRFSTKRGIGIYDPQQIDVYLMVSTSSGWTIKIDKNDLLADIKSADSRIKYIDGVFQLSDGETDKVRIGEAIVEAIIKAKNW